MAQHKMIFPSSMLDPKRVDEQFQHEADLVNNDYILFDSAQKKLVNRGTSYSGSLLVYRGWILTEAEYLLLETLVLDGGGQLLTSTVQYSQAQFGGFWAAHFAGLTPATVSVPYHTSITNIREIIDSSGINYPMVIKGQSKSLKHDWENSMFVKDVRDLGRVLGNFKAQITETEEPFILYREFEHWEPGELRTWWLSGKLIQSSPHPSTPDYTVTVSELSEIEKLLQPVVSAFDNSFIAVDVARAIRGGFRVVEVGDGQVCDGLTSHLDLRFCC
jgi:hypothetical protein